MSSQGSSFNSSSLALCHVCFKHFKLRQDGTFVRHGGKQSRSKFGHTLTNVLKALLDQPSNTISWFKLLFLPRLVLRKKPRGGRCHNISVKINNRLDALTKGPFKEMVNAFETDSEVNRKNARQPKLGALVKCKMEQGNTRNAMKILSSTDTMAPNSVDTLDTMKDKAPRASAHRKTRPGKGTTSGLIHRTTPDAFFGKFPKRNIRGKGWAVIFRGKRHDDFWVKKLDEFKYVLSMMVHISKHDALILLTQAAFIPKFSYFLRTSPSPSKQISDMFERELLMGFQSILNILFDDKGWCQAVLPICMGGLGIVADLAPSAFLSSAEATAILQNMMLPVEGQGYMKTT
ncbi:hypothetical protein HELRODRAFT_176009 [Helobdella robusta]|uniref:Uncharacterized protein n=1 Tax=Helobdella robusta TaxID=6412 RepID=T1FA08_HELRO|nr:hypothetical protein HELRODRAFT_176009 [Helobdella robusta]ESO00180.1 hypothetical protein HELRODRAFT_176009 [Helobdella robusta]